MATPAPAWGEHVYGGLFWLNRTGRVPIPEDAFWMGGDGEQRVTVVPSLNLVVVRLGHVSGGGTATTSLARALEGVAAAVMAGGESAETPASRRKRLINTAPSHARVR